MFFKILLLSSLALPACQTGKINSLKDDVFGLQTRLLELEHHQKQNSQVFDKNDKESRSIIANTSNDLDALKSNIMQLEGQVDMLKMSFKTGKLPEQTEEDSPKGQMNLIQQRLVNVEESQAEILDILSKIEKSQKRKQTEHARKPLKNLLAIKAAYTQKRYTHVIEDAPSIIKLSKGQDQIETKYYYAESLFKQGKASDAALAFHELLNQNSLKSKQAAIKLRLADCFRTLGDTKASHVYYQEVIAEFPKSAEATKAKEYASK